MNITKLKGYLPEAVYNELPSACKIAKITTDEELAHFLGQTDHESGSYKKTVENLNYSAEALWSLFKSHFKSPEEATTYARQPEKIANRIYANRMGNGGEASGDGYKRRGRGYIQLTGTKNQEKFFLSMGLPKDTNPEVISTVYPLTSAAWFWEDNNIGAKAKTVHQDSIKKVTLAINGGTNGLQDRIEKTEKYYKILVQ